MTDWLSVAAVAYVIGGTGVWAYVWIKYDEEMRTLRKAVQNQEKRLRMRGLRSSESDRKGVVADREGRR